MISLATLNDQFWGQPLDRWLHRSLCVADLWVFVWVIVRHNGKLDKPDKGLNFWISFDNVVQTSLHNDNGNDNDNDDDRAGWV